MSRIWGKLNFEISLNYHASLVFPNALSNCKRSVVPSGEPRNDMYLSQQYCQNVYSPDKTAPVYTTCHVNHHHQTNIWNRLRAREKIAIWILNYIHTSLKFAGITVPLVKKFCSNSFAWFIASVSSHKTAASNTSGRNNLQKKPCHFRNRLDASSVG